MGNQLRTETAPRTIRRRQECDSPDGPGRGNGSEGGHDDYEGRRSGASTLHRKT
jgi:hypothetical protein